MAAALFGKDMDNVKRGTRSFGGKLSLVQAALFGKSQTEDEKAAAIARLVAELRNDRSFKLDGEVDTYAKWALRSAREGGFKCVIYGHTHLAKDQPIHEENKQDAPVQYINTGTWADLMEFPNLSEADVAGAKRLLANLRAGKTKEYLKKDRRTFARVDLSPDDCLIEARLYMFANGKPESFT